MQLMNFDTNPPPQYIHQTTSAYGNITLNLKHNLSVFGFGLS